MCTQEQDSTSDSDAAGGQASASVQPNVWTELIQFDQSLQEDEEELEHPNQSEHSTMV